MVLALRPVFDLAKLYPGIIGRIPDDIEEHGRKDMLGAGAGHEIAPASEHFQGAEVDFLVPFGSPLHGGA